MADLLERMRRSGLERLAAARARVSADDLLGRIADLPAAPALRRDPSGFDLIAEFKPHAPSSGRLLREGDDPEQEAGRAAGRYAAAGAAAVSVLTEPTVFGGGLSLLAAASRHEVPVMRKDFLVDAYQVLEARAAGAAGVLLIVRMLDDAMLDRALDAVAELRMFALVETFDERDVDRAARALERVGPEPPQAGDPVRWMIGVNARDLVTLEVDAERTASLARRIPPGRVAVAESGLADVDDVASAAALGYDLALVGSALMRAEEPGGCLRAMLRAGRAAVTTRAAGGAP